MNRQFKAALSAVREFISGQSAEAQPPDADDKALRQVVAAELISAMTPLPDEGTAPANADTPNKEAGSDKTDVQPRAGTQQEKDRARKLFLEHGYFDEAVHALRAGNSSAERAEAARTLGLVGSQRATAHLIAALFDSDAEVRKAAEEALARIGGVTQAEPSSKTKTPSTETDKLPVETKKISAPAVIQRADAVGETKPVLEVPPVSHEEKTMEAATVANEIQVQGPVVAEAKNAVAKVTNGKQAFKAPRITAIDDEPEQLRLEEKQIRKAIEELEKRLSEASVARAEAEKEAQARSEREEKLRSQAAARRKKEEELRRQAQQEAERLRAKEEAAAAAEQKAHIEAVAGAHRFEEEEARLRLEAIGLRQAAADLALKRGTIEIKRQQLAEAAQQDEARRAREEAETLHTAEVARLRSEEEGFRSASEEVAQRRAEVEKAREKAEKDAQALLEAEKRMQAAEKARAEAEVQRTHLETEINERLKNERRLLEETRRRAAEEQKRLEEDIRKNTEEEERRMAKVEAMRLKAAQEAEERAERERQILSQVESIRIADAETRRRIEDAETSRRKAEQAYALVADKVQKVEAEAHVRSLEEQQILAKLEAARRDAAVEAKARAEQERRVKEEIEMFRRLEEEERPRLEAAILRRSDAEARVQQQRERIAAEEEAYQASLSRMPKPPEPPVARQATAFASTEIESPPAFTEETAIPDEIYAPEAEATGQAAEFPGVTPAIIAYLKSVDPYKRAAAVAELARSQAEGAFNLISECFDDHSAHVRNAAARALSKLDPNHTVDLFNRALDEGSEERRLNIGSAIAASGLATEAINNLAGDNREATYNALSILFVMAKSGEVQPLVRAVEEHANEEVCRAVIKLLTLSGHSEIGDAALQRRVMGISAVRSKAEATGQDSVPDIRMRIAEGEVKRANGKHQSAGNMQKDS